MLFIIFSIKTLKVKPISVNDDILLKPLELKDTADIFHAINTQRSYLGQWLPFVAFTHEPQDTQAFVESVLDAPEERREVVFTIRYKDEFAGIIGLKDTDRINHKTEIGYWLSETFQKKGIITQSVLALLRLAFEEMNLKRVQIRCAVGNTPSLHIPRKLGFVFEGIERAGELLTSGEYADLEVYSMLREEFFKQNA